MSSELIMTIVVCATLIVVVGMICCVKYLTTRDRDIDELLRKEEVKRRGDALRRQIEEKGIGPVTPYTPPSYTPMGTTQEGFESEYTYAPPEKPVKEPQDLSKMPQDLSKMPRLEVDPERMPSVMFYKPKSGAPVPKCFCHGQRLEEGDEVLLWPILDSKEVRIYCIPETK